MKQSNWQQTSVIHCPDRSCKGMLLEHPEHSPLKCSDCGKFWFDASILRKWIEVTDPEKGEWEEVKNEVKR